MERFPQGNEQNGPEQPQTLNLDLSGPDGNVFFVIGSALERLEGEELKDFKKIISGVMAPGTGRRYEDILAIVNSYVRLVDTSGTHPDYAEGAQE
jgi:hypothetical protein